jgi:HJR/Mrr/RecB family endonuclease
MKSNRFSCLVLIVFFAIINIPPKILISIIALFLILIFLLKRYHDKQLKKAEIEKQKEKCEHGIESGKYGSSCDICNKIKLKEIEDKKIKEKIKEDAQKLKSEEEEKLLYHKYKQMKYVLTLSPKDFEDYIAQLYQKLGYNVTQTPYTNDKGKDAILFKNNQKFLVECKKYDKTKSIGRPMLQKFYAAMVEEESTVGFFIATCNFTSSAIEYGKKFNIELIDIEKLTDLINEAYPENSVLTHINCMCIECGEIVKIEVDNHEIDFCKNGHSVINDIYISNSFIPSCIKCGIKMVLRNGKFGKFWGCANFPNCRVTIKYKN